MTTPERPQITRGGAASEDPPWCTTEHGCTVHPDDEDHRSDGVGVSVDVRSRRDHGATHSTHVEVGLVRRITEHRSWFVIEDGDSIHLEITIDSARRLFDAIEADPTLQSVLRP